MSPKRKKTSPKDYAALNCKVPGIRYPPGLDRATLTTALKPRRKQKERRRCCLARVRA